MSRPPGGGDGSGLLGALARPPGSAWPDGVLYHGARILLLLACAVLLTAVFPPEHRMQVSPPEVGMVADQDVVARIAFEVPRDPGGLELAQADARASTPPIFDLRPEASDEMTTNLEGFFAGIDSALAAEDTTALADVLTEHSIPLTPGQRELVRNPEIFGRIREVALRGAREILPRGVADGAQLRDYETDQTITVREGDGDRSVARSAVMTASEFYERVMDLLAPGSAPGVQEVLRLILIQFTEYSLELNVEATSTARARAAQAVRDVEGEILEQQVIVRAGDLITEQDVQQLLAYQSALEEAGLLETGDLELSPLFGAGLLNTLILAVFGLLLFFFRREVYTNPRWVALIALLVVAFVGAAALVAGYGLRYEVLPIAFVALAVAVLWDGRIALVLAAVLAVAVGAQPPFAPQALPVVITTFLGGAAAALSVRVVRRRVQAWVFGALIAAAYLLVIVALTLVGSKSPGELGPSLAYAGGNAFLSAILAMGFLPVFEWFTGITTDQTLLEWADPNRPLLKRLSLEAPGTYAHTINVANLAEAAASVIAANGLLCRVGLYYHDVGKMLKPHYFVENQPQGRNPHDRLKPDTSASIVKEHVTEGLKMAREAGVPEVVAAFIPEHHGDQRIGFFWEKAKEEYGEEGLDPEDFRYPGPRPRSRETAIAMLADSVESATRALQDPTSERVRTLIDSIVEGKIADGQLDEAPLTLGEVGRIKEQFVKVLSSIYHHRIDYPQTRHLTEAPREMGGDAPLDIGGAGAGGAGEKDGGPETGGAAADGGDDAAEPPAAEGTAGSGADAGGPGAPRTGGAGQG